MGSRQAMILRQAVVWLTGPSMCLHELPREALTDPRGESTGRQTFSKKSGARSLSLMPTDTAADAP